MRRSRMHAPPSSRPAYLPLGPSCSRYTSVLRSNSSNPVHYLMNPRRLRCTARCSNTRAAQQPHVLSPSPRVSVCIARAVGNEVSICFMMEGEVPNDVMYTPNVPISGGQLSPLEFTTTVESRRQYASRKYTVHQTYYLGYRLY